jgi:hypothetical protein
MGTPYHIFRASQVPDNRLQKTRRRFDALITSPPYLTAVDYYRRHTLEMYWLDSGMTPDRRRALRGHYIGQSSVSAAMVTRTANAELSARTKKLARQIERIRRPKVARFPSLLSIDEAHFGGGNASSFGEGISRL